MHNEFISHHTKPTMGVLAIHRNIVHIGRVCAKSHGESFYVNILQEYSHAKDFTCEYFTPNTPSKKYQNSSYFAGIPRPESYLQIRELPRISVLA